GWTVKVPINGGTVVDGGGEEDDDDDDDFWGRSGAGGWWVGGSHCVFFFCSLFERAREGIETQVSPGTRFTTKTKIDLYLGGLLSLSVRTGARCNNKSTGGLPSAHIQLAITNFIASLPLYSGEATVGRPTDDDAVTS